MQALNVGAHRGSDRRPKAVGVRRDPGSVREVTVPSPTRAVSVNRSRSQFARTVPDVAATRLVVESTYGNREHDDAPALDGLAAVVERTARRGGTVVIPAVRRRPHRDRLFHLARLSPPDASSTSRPRGQPDGTGVAARLPACGASAGRNAPRLREWDPVRPRHARGAHATSSNRVDDGLRYPAPSWSRRRGWRRVAACAPPSGGATTRPRNAIVLVGFQAECTRGREPRTRHTTRQDVWPVHPRPRRDRRALRARCTPTPMSSRVGGRVHTTARRRVRGARRARRGRSALFGAG